MNFIFRKLTKPYSEALGIKYQVLHVHGCGVGDNCFVWPPNKGELDYHCFECLTKLPDTMILQWRLLESE